MLVRNPAVIRPRNSTDEVGHDFSPLGTRGSKDRLRRSPLIAISSADSRNLLSPHFSLRGM
jgi:hypothetical protein